ncbi:MAG: hypothetical protein AABY22_09780 [Nanoarchaeota archaeon]
MKQTYQELNPSFARIFINKKDKKNPVTISYPAKREAFEALSAMWFNIIFSYRKTLLALSFVLMLIITSLIYYGLYIFAIGLSLGMMIVFWLSPLILVFITLHNKKLYMKMPDIYAEAMIRKENEYMYVKRTKLDKKTFEIPIFDNIFLDYKMKGEFKNYFKTVSIEEHDLYYATFDKKHKRKGIIQTDYWKCIFTFIRIPKKGYMEVRFL